MTGEWKEWWLYYVKKNTPEGYFHIPLEPKSIDDMTIEEFDLLDSSEWEMKIDDVYGITWFICRTKNN